MSTPAPTTGWHERSSTPHCVTKTQRPMLERAGGAPSIGRFTRCFPLNVRSNLGRSYLRATSDVGRQGPNA